MDFELTSEDRYRIEESIREKYTEYSKSPKGKFTYPTGREGLHLTDFAQVSDDTKGLSTSYSFCPPIPV